MEEISIPWKTVKGIWKWNCEVPEKWQKVVEQMVNTLFYIVLDEMKNISFIFTLKWKEFFGPPYRISFNFHNPLK